MDGTLPIRSETVDLGELIALCAVDTGLFGSTFFPRAMRDISPPMHEDWDRLLDDTSIRYLNLVAPRGFAKTTKLRVFAAKRIAYGLSHTILYIGASEDHARRSIMWLQRNIATRDPSTGAFVPTEFARTFGLRPGAKWNETEIEVYVGVDDRPVWILGAGITGNIRGINFDDYRPDLIVIDDGLTDENTATPDQRNKTIDLVYKALKESLAPKSDEPNAKLVFLNTPHHPDDLTGIAAKDPLFVTARFSCWTPQTEDLPLELQESAWPEVKPTLDLRKEKSAAIHMNRYSSWAAENECKLVTAERAAFRVSWLRYWDDENAKAPPMFCVVAIDPVPPPSDIQLAKGLSKKDYESVAVIGRFKGNYYLLDYEKTRERGHNPDWTIATAFSLASKYKAARFVIQGINYERTLKWYLEKEMARQRRFWAVNTNSGDKRSKFNQIVSSLQGVASQGRLFVSHSHVDFISQFETYPAIPHEDLLDVVALGLTDLVNPYLELADSDWGAVEGGDEYPELEFKRACP